MKEIRKLEALGVCDDAIEYMQTQPDYQTAWQNCERGDWMLWLLQKKLDLKDESQLRLLTLAKARCAKLVLHLMKYDHSKKAVEIAEAFGNGNATRQELDDAAYAAYADAAAAYADADSAYADAAYAAYAAADSAYAAAAADSAYADAAYAAYAAADSADAAYAADARKSVLQQCAEIVRAIFPLAPEL